MKVYTNNATVKVRIETEEGTAVFSLKPLTQAQKMELIKSDVSSASGQMEMVVSTLRYCLKSVDGLTDEADNPWTIKHDDDMVATESMDVLLNLPQLLSPLSVASMQLLAGIPKEGAVLHPETKEPLDGVTISLGK